MSERHLTVPHGDTSNIEVSTQYFCNGRMFPTRDAMREYKKRKNSDYDYAHYTGFKWKSTTITVVERERCN